MKFDLSSSGLLLFFLQKNMSETRLFEIVIINFVKMEVALFMIFKEQALAQL